MASKSAVRKMTKREALVDKYIKTKADADTADAAFEVAKTDLKADLGETQETMCGPFRISYRPDKEIDQARLKTEHPEVFSECQTKFNVGLFREKYPELVEAYERDSNKRPLHVNIV